MFRFAAVLFARIVALALVVLTLLTLPAAAQVVAPVSTLLEELASRQELEPLKTVIVARDGKVLAERGYRGNRVTDSTNIKSASKSIISALVGIAIDKGLLEGRTRRSRRS